MSKIFSLLILTIILLSIVSGFSIYQFSFLQSTKNELIDENIELQNRVTQLEDQIEKMTDQASIIRFSISGFKPSVGLVIYESNVYVRIQNLGVNILNGLKLIIIGFGDEKLAETIQVNSINPGEVQEIYAHTYWVYGSEGTSVATLKLGDTILDEYILPFSEVY
jgi:hypothetical protein